MVALAGGVGGLCGLGADGRKDIALAGPSPKGEFIPFGVAFVSLLP